MSFFSLNDVPSFYHAVFVAFPIVVFISMLDYSSVHLGSSALMLHHYS